MNDQSLALPLQEPLARFEAMKNQALTHIAHHDTEIAIRSCQRLNKAHPNNPESWYISSSLALKMKDPTNGIAAIKRALALAPDNGEFLLRYSHFLILSGDKKQARKVLLTNIDVLQQHAQSLQSVNGYGELALQLNAVAEYQMAAKCYQNALLFSPNNGELYFNLASVQRYLGLLSEAEANFDLAIKYNPNDAEAYLQRSSLKKQTRENNHLESLRQAIKTKSNHPIARAQLHYALAKELEDLKDYQVSFEQLKLGARCRRRHMNYRVEQDVEALNLIRTTYDKHWFEQTKANTKEQTQGASAIFILGLPRTGSTLVERIVSSHSQVTNAGELNDFAVCMMEHAQQHLRGEPSKAQMIQAASQVNANQLGKSYLKRVSHLDINTEKFVDKLPLNSLYLGLIGTALPSAKLIHVKRHPMDTCYAIYKQIFTQGYPFSYDLEELGRYYIAHHRLMEHWLDTMGSRILQVNYEQVVADLETQARRLLAHCGLAFESQCLQFNHNKSASTTASASQVRQGIYNTSVQRWRCYEVQLQPLKKQLEAAGIDCS
ncbi:tetratricopeptide repeat-containing sulfotransferase family protein [Paraferrimonas haliotis]|uniref:tetratricopeptide repeat-containing sulfotransferase family protein n=1 Tax=Paraferrimonas haliotis TaxID=2013866 RepID=UPI000BA98EB9|nr:sulfotransferase [Paraferrimonas haliotis]